MSILIKGMEMPKSCWHCEFCRDGLDEHAQHYDYCVALDMNIQTSQTERHENCPLIEVPTPHGRLIDADALMKLLVCNENTINVFWFEDIVNQRPSIIDREDTV